MASEALASLLVPVIQGHLEGLLTQISKDYDLDLEELKTRYLSPATATVTITATKPPKAPRGPKGPPANPCKGKTAKGEPCAVSAKDGCDLCHLHLKAQNKPRKVKEARVACTGKTGKGAPCQVRAQAGQTLCHLHIKAQKTKQAIRAETQVEQVFCEPCSQPMAEAVPVPVPVSASQAESEILSDDGANLMSRLQAIIRSANNSEADSDSEKESEAPEEQMMGVIKGSNPPLKPVKLSVEQIRSMGFDDEDEDDFDMEQMESPTSRARLEDMGMGMGDGGYLSE